MKTKWFLFLALAMTLTLGLNAQDQTVGVGATKNYSAAGSATGNTYLWSLSDATAANIITATASATDIKWLKPGTYTLTYRETNPNSTTCYAEFTKSILVTGNTLSMGTAPASFCAPVTGTSPLTFVVNRTGGTNAVTVNYSYTINGGTATTGSVTIAANTNTQNITFNAANPNDGHTDNVVVLTITSATDADGNTIDVTTTPLTQTVTLYATPVVTGITFN